MIVSVTSPSVSGKPVITKQLCLEYIARDRQTLFHYQPSIQRFAEVKQTFLPSTCRIYLSNNQPLFQDNLASFDSLLLGG